MTWNNPDFVRCVVDLNSDRRGDIVGFGADGVWVARGRGDGGFNPPVRASSNFGANEGWTVAAYPRMIADVTGDGRADVVGFGNDGVWTALGQPDGTFGPRQLKLAAFGGVGGWTVESHLRLAADLTGDGRADIIGFANDGVWTSLNDGAGNFAAPRFVVGDFGFNQAWRVDQHPRLLADLTGDGRPDIVGFGNAGVYTSLNRGGGDFAPPQLGSTAFGANGGWRVDQHPRFAVDLTGDGRADIIGFATDGVWTALGDGVGGFAPARIVLPSFSVSQGWRVDRHPRMLADVTGDGRPDIVGFGDEGVWIALNNGDGTFAPPYPVIGFGYNDNWRVGQHPRFAVDLTGDGRADIVGFGEAGVWVSLNTGGGAFAPPQLVMNASEDKNATYFKTGRAIPLPNPAIPPQVLCPSNLPLVLFPVRLETRFFTLASGAVELRIRVFPEQIHIDSHQPELTTDERTWGVKYWQQDWTAADDNARGDAWRMLASRYGAARAAWIARTLKPTNMAQRTVKPPVPAVFPTLPPVAPGGEAVWRTAPKARLLPDRWVAMAHSGGKLALTATSKPVRRPLAVGPDPEAPALDAKTDAAVRAGTALPIDPGMKWLVDYDEAELAGMAFRMTVPPGVLAAGIESLVVFGVSAGAAPADTAAQLADLLDAHSYTDGLQFLPFGASTNNTEDQRAGFTTDDPDHQRSYRNEVILDPTKAANASRLGRALGLPTARIAPTLGHLEGADGDHDLDLCSMNTALWPVGWGYFLSNMVGSQAGLSAASHDWARSHFLAHVRAGGPLPALRVGRQPYGVLPVTSLDLWAPGMPGEPTGPQDAWLKPALIALRDQVWRPVLGQVARIGLRNSSPDPDADLADAMAVEGVSHAYTARRALGGQYLRHLHAIQNLGMSGAIEAQTPVSNRLLGVLGMSLDAAKRPRLAGLFYEPDAFDVTAPLIQAGNLPEGTPAPTYIQDLLKPVTISTLALAAHNSSLFEALLRHGLLREYAVAAARIYATTGADLATLLRDPELVDLVDLPRDGFILRPPPQDKHWQRQLDEVVAPITGTDTIRAFLEKLKVFTHRTVTSLGEFRKALDRLSRLEAGRLEILLQSTLDLSSHRLDAWITSVATKRLAAMRGAAAIGQYVGAYGWVENLHPADAPTPVPDAALPKGEPGPLVRPADESGFIHAPSSTHAAAAALLRNAHLGPRGKPEPDGPFAIDLSSRRVREANRLLDGVRSGQPLGALLGYRLERRLQDLRLSPLIAPLRAAAPLAIRDRGAGAAAGDPKLLAANNVVDGLALAQAFKAAPDRTKYLRDTLPDANDTDRGSAQREIEAVLDDIDGLSDALTAETAYQLARGNTARLGATLAAVAQGSAPPPELEVARTPRSGVSLTHRVAVLFDSALPAAAGWPAPATSPLSATEGSLDTWVGRLLGDPRKIRCTVERLADDGKAVAQTIVFPVSELNLTPLDVIYGLDDTAGAAPAGASQSYLEQLVTYNTQRRAGGSGASTNLRIQTARPTNLAAGEITFSDMLEQARAIRRLLEHARGLRPEDLAPPERPAQGVIDVAGLLAQVKAGEDALAAVHKRVDGRVKAGGVTAADLLRADLLALGAFGIRPAAPCVAVGDTPEIRDQLLRQCAALLAVSGPRLDRAAALRLAPAATDPGPRCTQLLEYGKAVFGPRFVLLPRFTCDAAGAAELKSALAASTAQQGGDPLAVHAWFSRSSQVREPVAALGRCLRGAEVLATGDRLALSVAQLPFDAAERWVGLPVLPGTALAASKLSIAVQAYVAPVPTTVLAGLFVDEWVEVVPSTTETTALTFQFNPPNAFAPQAVLLATPPKPGQDWTTETLRQVLVETLDLAKLRAVDPALLGAAAQYLPGVYLPFNAAGHAVSTDLQPLTL